MKTPKENVIDTLKGKKVLFIENDNGLYDGVDDFENILKEANIEYKCIFEACEKPIDDIIADILAYDCIVFMTQWRTEVSFELKKFLFSLKESKIIVQVYIHEPTWFYKPDTAHEVYIYTGPDDIFDDSESFYKLSDKAYWDYENNFDK